MNVLNQNIDYTWFLYFTSNNNSWYNMFQDISRIYNEAYFVVFLSRKISHSVKLYAARSDYQVVCCSI